MPLPSRWIDALFSKLTLTYGQAFLRQWEGVPIETVKAEWANELGGFEVAPVKIAYALSILNPDKPPNILQFKAFCIKAPSPVVLAIGAPPADPVRVAEVVASIKKTQSQVSKGWTARLKAREEAGEKLNSAQRMMWREAVNEGPMQ